MANTPSLIDSATKFVGRTVAWFVLAMVIIQFVVVVLRFTFGINFIWMQESVLYLHGFLFLLAAAWTLQADRHVRLDIFYRDAGARAKAWINLVGVVVFLWPICLTIGVVSWPYVIESWAVLEGSTETSGIRGRFVQKTAILGFAVLLALQGVAQVFRSLDMLRGENSGPGNSGPQMSGPLPL